MVGNSQIYQNAAHVLMAAGPFAGVNLDTFDGKGKMTISGMSSVNVSAGTVIHCVARKQFPQNED
ncbi:MAG TPA: hypothetical protein VKT75_09880 [Acidobacteriaceae bacterium]|nr:hypothetical protein [Acidobacteriaceae bacterium]